MLHARVWMLHCWHPTHHAGNTFCLGVDPQATELLSAGLKKYVAGDRMGALTLFEESLKKVC